MDGRSSRKIEIKNTLTDLPENIKSKLAEANVFFSKEYSEYARICGQEMIYAYDDKFIASICVYKKLFLKYALFVSEPFLYEGENSIELYKAFLDCVLEELKSTKIAWISTSAGSLFDAYPKDSVRIPFGNYIVDLTLSEEELWSKVHSKHRNSIRRAEKGEVQVRFGGEELVDDYIKLDKETWARSGKASYGTNFFKQITEGLGKCAEIAVAYKDNIPQAGGVFFKNDQMSYYMYGTSADHPEPGSANLLQWRTMIRFKKEGVKRYSFVGCRINEDVDSKYHNIQRFKERFGGGLRQGYMFRSDLHPLMRKVFLTLYKIKNHKDLVDAIDMEVHKWPELNQR